MKKHPCSLGLSWSQKTKYWMEKFLVQAPVRSSATGRRNYRHMVFLMAIGAGNKKSWVNGLGVLRLAEIGFFRGDCIHKWEPKWGQYQPKHLISSYGYNLILCRIWRTILVIYHCCYSNLIGLKLKWLFSGRQVFCGPE